MSDLVKRGCTHEHLLHVSHIPEVANGRWEVGSGKWEVRIGRLEVAGEKWQKAGGGRWEAA